MWVEIKFKPPYAYRLRSWGPRCKTQRVRAVEQHADQRSSNAATLPAMSADTELARLAALRRFGHRPVGYKEWNSEVHRNLPEIRTQLLFFESPNKRQGSSL